jgi:hypothetical protein
MKEMNQIPINEEKNAIYNKKAVKIILLLFVLGIVTGLILSYVFIDEANQRIENMGDGDYPPPPQDADYNPEPLKTSDVILPSLGVIIICISLYLLLGLIMIYISIFLKTNSKYIVGLLFFLSPLFIQSILSVNTLRSLFVSSAIPYMHIRESIGFGFGGLGGVIVMVSIFEIIGLSILLYLSAE